MRFNEIGVHLIRVNPGHICASHLSSHDHYFNHRHTILPLLLSIEITSTYLPAPILHVYMAHTIVKKRYRTMIQCTCTMTSKSCNSGEGEDNKITSFLQYIAKRMEAIIGVKRWFYSQFICSFVF